MPVSATIANYYIYYSTGKNTNVGMLSPVAIEKYKKECWKEICTLPTDLTGAGHDTGKTTQRVIYHGEIFPQVEL